MNKKSIRRAGALMATVVVGVFSLSACAPGAATGTDTGQPIRVGVLVDSSSYLKGLDGGTLKGIEKAIEQANEAGGVLGRQIELVIEDTAADPERQVKSFQQIVNQGDTTAFLNGTSSAGNAAIAPMAMTSKVPVISTAVLPAVEAEYTFSTATPPAFEAAVRAKYLQEQGLTKVAILGDPSPYSKMVTAEFEKQAEKYGLEVLTYEEHTADVVDLRPQATKLLQSNPDAIVKTSTGPASIIAAKALGELDADIPFVVGVETEANLGQAADAYPNLFFAASPPMVYEALAEDQRTDALNELYEEFTEDSDLTDIAAGWDGAHLLIKAIEEADSASGEAVRDALISMSGINGAKANFDYTAEDHAGITTNPMYLSIVREDGSFENVYSMAE